MSQEVVTQLSELLEKAAGAEDIVREMMGFVAQRPMDMMSRTAAVRRT